jgi:hypothetical protein
VTVTVRDEDGNLVSDLEADDFVVKEDGKVDRRNIRIIRSTDSRLEQSVEYWIRRCVYRPGMIGDHEVRVRMREKFDLRLNR